MSFNLYNTGWPPFLLTAIAAIVWAPRETPAAQTAFWIGLVAALVVYHLLYAPIALAEGEPGGAACCGVLATGGPVLYAVYGAGWGGPIAQGLAPGLVLGAGPTVYLIGVAALRARVRLATWRAARASDGGALLPLLFDPAAPVREAALARADGLGLAPVARLDLLIAFLRRVQAATDYEGFHDPVATRLLEPLAADPTALDLAAWLEAYTASPGFQVSKTDRRLDRAVAERWDGDDPTPLAEAARARLARVVPGEVDAVARALLERAPAAGEPLIRDALVVGAVSGEAVARLGPERAASACEAALDATGAGCPSEVVAAVLRLPGRLAFPLLGRILASGGARQELAFGVALRELQPEFGQVPGSDAVDLLASVEALRTEARTGAERETWERLADAVRAATAEV